MKKIPIVRVPKDLNVEETYRFNIDIGKRLEPDFYVIVIRCAIDEITFEILLDQNIK